MVDDTDPRRFAPWVRAHREKNGVYLVVQDDLAQYVGVSYSRKLYGTLTRHVQEWSRRKSKAYTGPVFDRFAILLSVEVIEDPVEARTREQEWIHRFQPLLNRQELPFGTKRAPAELGDAYEGPIIGSEAEAMEYLGRPGVIEDEIDAMTFFEGLASR